jgi:Domain of unknown function (DUF4395)
MTTLANSTTSSTAARRPIDVRGPRFGAAVTTVVLALTLLTIPSTLSVVLLAVQTLAFALGSLVGLQAQPYGVLFRRVVRPRLAPPTEFEDPAPPRFAQTVGLGFALVGLIGLLVGATTVAYVAVGFALAAAFLNAVFAYCLGCEVYLLGKRALSRS